MQKLSRSAEDPSASVKGSWKVVWFRSGERDWRVGGRARAEAREQRREQWMGTVTEGKTGDPEWVWRREVEK